MKPIDLETTGGVYFNHFRFMPEEGVFTLVEGFKYLMPPEVRRDPPYLEVVVPGLLTWGPEDEEVFLPDETVSFLVSRRVCRGLELIEDDAFYQETRVSWVETEEGEPQVIWEVERL